jgi:hypothetical protein
MFRVFRVKKWNAALLPAQRLNQREIKVLSY